MSNLAKNIGNEPKDNRVIKELSENVSRSTNNPELMSNVSKLAGNKEFQTGMSNMARNIGNELKDNEVIKELSKDALRITNNPKLMQSVSDLTGKVSNLAGNEKFKRTLSDLTKDKKIFTDTEELIKNGSFNSPAGVAQLLWKNKGARKAAIELARNKDVRTTAFAASKATRDAHKSGLFRGGGVDDVDSKKKTLMQKMKDSVFGEEVEKCVEPSIFDSITSKQLQESTNIIVIMICFIFEYSFLILESFRWVLEELIPKLCYNLRVPPALCYIFIFIFLFTFNQHSLTILKNLIIDIINVNYQNVFLGILIAVVIFYYMRSYVTMPDPRKTDLMSRLMMFPINIPYAAFLLIKELIRMAIMIIVAIPVGAMLCIFYVLWVSIVTNIVKFFKENIKNGIITYIRDFHKPEAQQADTSGMDDQSSSGFFTIIDKILLSAYNYLIFIVLIFYCINVLSSHMGDIHGSLLQQVVQYLHLALLAIVFAWLYYLYIYYKRNGSESIIASLVLPPLKAFKYILFIIFSILLAILSICICIVIYALFYAVSKTDDDNNKQWASEMKDKITNEINKLYKGSNDSSAINKPDITNKNAETNWNKNPGGPSNDWNTVIGSNGDSINVINGDATTSWNNKK